MDKGNEGVQEKAESMLSRRIEIAVSAVEYIALDTRCTCPQEYLQYKGKHYQDCPRKKIRQHIRRVLESLVQKEVG